MLHLTECKNLTTEDTRLSNPPSTLRGTGWNRWKWLCQDPQERVLVPFDYEVDTRNTTRDNIDLLFQHQKTLVIVFQHQITNQLEMKLLVFRCSNRSSKCSVEIIR